MQRWEVTNYFSKTVTSLLLQKFYSDTILTLLKVTSYITS